MLERAQQAKPDSYDNGYDLAMADFLTGRLGDARNAIESLLSSRTLENSTTCLARSMKKTVSSSRR